MGYRELFPYLEGKQSLEESVENIKKNTRRFAKRQLTWLRNHPVMHKLPYNTPIDNGLRDLLGI